VLASRSFDSIAELDGRFRRLVADPPPGSSHPGQVIAVHPDADRPVLQPLPAQPYLVAEKHLRRVGMDCVASSNYSVPIRLVRAGQRVQLHAQPGPVAGDRISIHALIVDGGAWMVDSTHWDGLPAARTRATVVEAVEPPRLGPPAALEPLSAVLTRRHADHPRVAEEREPPAS
jgi:hypothetical protein